MHWAPYQLRWLNDRSRMRACVKSRRIGFSEVVAFESAGRALGLEFVDGKFHQCKPVPQNFVSATERKAIELLEKVVVHIRVLAIAFVGDVFKKPPSAHEVILADGTRLKAFSTNPLAIRSDGGDVVIDEAGALPHAEKIWRAAEPVARAHLGDREGYRVSIVGTPEGDTNWFHAVMHDDRYKRFSRHRIDIHEAKRDGFPIDIEAAREETGDPDAFAQEYECSFLSSSMRYIPAELWDACCLDPHQIPDHALNVPRYGGYDVGRHHDAAAYGEVALFDERLWQEGLVEYERKMPFGEQEAWIGRKISDGVQRVALDAGGMGEVQSERLVNQYRSRIEPVKFTLEMKEVLATGLKTTLETRMFAPRRDDIPLRTEALLMRRIVSEAGNVRFDIQRTKGAHGDGAWSMALAIHASGKASKIVKKLRPHALVPRAQATDPREPVRPMVQPRRRAWE
jgi:phage FluMu gp28-like protein